jgi:hypothetical protein
MCLLFATFISLESRPIKVLSRHFNQNKSRPTSTFHQITNAFNYTSGNSQEMRIVGFSHTKKVAALMTHVW